MKVLLIAGFGDNASMYDALLATDLADQHELVPLDLPGFGAPALPGQTSLAALGAWVTEQARAMDAQAIVAHSVASIIASIAAQAQASPVRHIISLEGNLTAKDAYFSGRAADFTSAAEFRDWFLPRIEAKASSDPILARYAREVRTAAPQALWELGCDAHRFSQSHHPGEWLKRAGRVTYVVNRANCAVESMAWLDQGGLQVAELPGASHWPTINQPEQLAAVIKRTLAP